MNTIRLSLLLGTFLATIGMVTGCRQTREASIEPGCPGCSDCVISAPCPGCGIRPITPAPVPTYKPVAPKDLPPVAEHIVIPREPQRTVSAKVSESPAAPKKDPFDQMFERRSFADITADPRFAHAEDYTWLVGKVMYLHSRGTWRLRYCSVDEEDRYGGSVTLVGTNQLLSSLHDSQIIRVHGHLIDPESREPTPEYRVDEIVSLD